LPLRLALGGPAFLHDGQAAVQLHGRGVAVFLRDVARGLAVQVQPRRRLRQRLQVGRAGGVAVQEDGQRLLVEQARRALLDVSLYAQLDGQGAAGAEERREQLGQLGGHHGGRQVGNGRCRGCSRRRCGGHAVGRAVGVRSCGGFGGQVRHGSRRSLVSLISRKGRSRFHGGAHRRGGVVVFGDRGILGFLHGGCGTRQGVIVVAPRPAARRC
jgi:hypothetical protein